MRTLKESILDKDFANNKLDEMYLALRPVLDGKWWNWGPNTKGIKNNESMFTIMVDCLLDIEKMYKRSGLPMCDVYWGQCGTLGNQIHLLDGDKIGGQLIFTVHHTGDSSMKYRRASISSQKTLLRSYKLRHIKVPAAVFDAICNKLDFNRQ